MNTNGFIWRSFNLNSVLSRRSYSLLSNVSIFTGCISYLFNSLFTTRFIFNCVLGSNSYSLTLNSKRSTCICSTFTRILIMFFGFATITRNSSRRVNGFLRMTYCKRYVWITSYVVSINNTCRLHRITITLNSFWIIVSSCCNDKSVLSRNIKNTLGIFTRMIITRHLFNFTFGRYSNRITADIMTTNSTVRFVTLNRFASSYRYLCSFFLFKYKQSSFIKVVFNFGKLQLRYTVNAWSSYHTYVNIRSNLRYVNTTFRNETICAATITDGCLWRSYP